MNSFINGIGDRATELYVSMPEVSPNNVGVLLLGVGGALGAAYIEKRWWPVWKAKREAKRFAKSETLRKAKRVREAMDIREVRLREMLSEMITDGVLDRQVKGELSNQEGKKLLADLSLRLNLPDLVPLKSRKEIVKQEIKARFHKGLYKRNPLEERNETPPEKAVGKPVNKYWRAKAVAA